ncbi:MAG: phenylalanine--tRNA ligase subunit alpha [Paludibacteraceae bacterium]|nr:phenylalanine--tRNA ligase subunit alpha [Paludibacteraceae bacterium]
MALKDKVQTLLSQVNDLKASNNEEIEALRIKYLSKKGEITALFNDFRSVAPEEKRELGQLLNQLRQQTEARINELREKIANDQLLTTNDRLDLTRTPDPIQLGTRHPLSLVREEIIDIFSRIGFTVAEGPEVEDDKHVYGMLNFAPEHPARDMQDTFFVEKEMGVQKPTDILLRSHTSSVQTRVMTSQKPPIRVLCPGRVYRNEAISARAHCFFHQVEGLYIDRNVSFADLREALLYFSKEMFGPETKIRLRPSYFPFTEPSAEMDISCDLCGGKGCSFCKGTGWVEILGCGMVDPNVLEACGIDSKEYSGYAFGMGVERITNLKYRVKDLRLFSENDVRFLRQFESC